MNINNIWKLVKDLKPYIDQGKISMEDVFIHLQKKGVEVTGVVSQLVRNAFKKKGGSKDEVFDDTVVELPMDEQGFPFNPNKPLDNVKTRDDQARIDWYKKAADKKRYSDDFYSGDAQKNMSGVKTTIDGETKFRSVDDVMNIVMGKNKKTDLGGVTLKGDESFDELMEIEKSGKHPRDVDLSITERMGKIKNLSDDLKKITDESDAAKGIDFEAITEKWFPGGKPNKEAQKIMSEGMEGIMEVNKVGKTQFKTLHGLIKNEKFNADRAQELGVKILKRQVGEKMSDGDRGTILKMLDGIMGRGPQKLAEGGSVGLNYLMGL
jgi:hypothetical protein